VIGLRKDKKQVAVMNENGKTYSEERSERAILLNMASEDLIKCWGNLKIKDAS